MENVGNRIRMERRKQDLTLEQLSQKTGVSKSFLSQIERGKLNPSIASLKKISRALDLSVVNLFTPINNNINQSNLGHIPDDEIARKEPPEFINDIKVVRADRRKVFALRPAGTFYELLTPDMNRRMELFFISAKPSEDSGEEPVIDPPGEKFCLVLKGICEIRIGDEVHELKAGDSIYFPSNLPQRWRAKGKGPMDMIVATTPPWF